MKKLTQILATLLVTACITTSALAETALVSVNGMVCAFCVQSIKKKVEGNEQVQNAEVDLDKKLVTINFKEGKGLSDEAITQAIVDAGYTVTGIERKP